MIKAPFSWLAALPVLIVVLVSYFHQSNPTSSSTGGFLVSAEEMTCAADGTCAPDEQFSIKVVNDSKHRADIHWDDGRFGEFITSLDANGGMELINAFADHEFFITRHGTKEGLFHVKTDTPYRFKALRPLQVFTIPKDAAPSKNPCQDRFGVCSNYASHGSCSDNPGWMIVHCCKSCDPHIDAAKLIDPKVRCSKKNLNITKPAWQPGDLDLTFRRWATDKEFAKYKPTVLSSPNPTDFGGQEGPWVMTFDDFLTDAEADALIKGANMVGFERSTDQGRTNDIGEMEKVVSKTRTSSNAWCIGACEELPEVDQLTTKIEEVTGVSRQNYESFQILEYEPDQFYRMHHDSTGRDKTPSGPRILTFFLYLTDVEEGGETFFNKLDIAVRPKKGRALVWPSVKDDEPDYWDDRMYHEAKDVIKGKKFAANHWIHLNDYLGPNKWGCTGSFS